MLPADMLLPQTSTSKRPLEEKVSGGEAPCPAQACHAVHGREAHSRRRSLRRSRPADRHDSDTIPHVPPAFSRPVNDARHAGRLLCPRLLVEGTLYLPMRFEAQY